LALIIGRFQPFSNNHMEVLETIKRDFGPKKILLGVGVSGKMDERNFLNFEEIKEMITPILNKLGVKYEIKAIPDINNPPKYARHVKLFFPEMNEDNTQIFTDNPYTGDCFDKHGNNYKVTMPKILSKIRATDVRKLMKEGENWEKLVPKPVAEYIKKNNCLERLG